MRFFHRRFEEKGLKPRELTAILSEKEVSLSSKKGEQKLTITDTLLGPRGAVVMRGSVTLPLSEWKDIFDALSKVLEREDIRP